MSDRTDIANQIAHHMGQTTAQGLQAVDIVLKSIIATLARGEEVAIPGLGKFSVVHRAAREGRNPKTREKIAIPAWTTVTFRPYKALKDALNPAPVRKVGPARNSPMPQRRQA